MRTQTLLQIALAGGFALSVGACSECAGTPSCTGAPSISYGGQFIEHKSGSPVSGVRISFVRESGVNLMTDSVSVSSGGDGHFVLRVGALADGAAHGRLVVVPPVPHEPYTIAGVSLSSSTVRGDGGWLGRLVVNPYLLMVGIVRDRGTLARLPKVTVIMRRTGGGRAAEDSASFVTDFGGQFSWEPEIVESGTIEATFEIRAPGYRRPYVVEREMPIAYRDGEIAFVLLPVGSGLAYSGTTARRGSGEQFPGVTIEFRRTGGIATRPAEFSLSPDPHGSFPMPLEPLADGTLFGELRIVPPAPFPVEVIPLELATSDDDVVEWLGFMGYGASVFLETQLRFADNGELLPPGTGITMQRKSGVPLDWRNPQPNGDERAVGDSGRLVYLAPASDSGMVTFDMIVRLPPPLAWDTLRSLVIPARYNDTATVIGPLHVRRRQRP